MIFMATYSINISFKEMKHRIPQVHILMKCAVKGYGCTSKYHSTSYLLMLSSFTTEHKRRTQYL